MLIIMRIMIDHQPTWLWTTIKCGILKIKSINHNNKKMLNYPILLNVPNMTNYPKNTSYNKEIEGPTINGKKDKKTSLSHLSI